MNFNWKKLLIN